MTLWQKFQRCCKGFVEDEAPDSAAAISFYAVTSLPPLIVLFISCAGLLISDESFQVYLISEAGQLFGPSGSEIVSMIIVQSEDQRHGLAAIVGLVTLVITAGGLHAQLQSALNKVWNIERRKQAALKRFVGDRLLASLTIAVTGFILILSLFVTTFFRATSAWFSERFHVDFMSAERAQSLASFVLLTVMIALLYKLLPDARIAWRDVWRGALITSLLFAGARYVAAIYLAKTSLTVSYGQAGALALLLVWIYLSALIFLFGAEWTSIEAEVRGRNIVARNPTKMRVLLRCMNDFPALGFEHKKSASS